MLRFLIFVGGVMMSSASMAEGVSKCPVDSLPIQIVDVKGIGSVTTLSAAKRADSFSTLVPTVTEHIAAKLSGEGLCLDSSESKERSLLQFVSWTTRSSNPSPVHRLDVHPSKGCLILSPWIDLAIERKSALWVRAIVRWNPRQLLADQAVLAGAKNVPPGVAKPLTNAEFSNFAMSYAYSEILREPITATPIEEIVPPDLLWLFRRSWQSTRAPFSGLAHSAMVNAVNKGEDSHTKLVLALIDRCFASDSVELRYDNILGVADLISLERYKIDTPIR